MGPSSPATMFPILLHGAGECDKFVTHSLFPPLHESSYDDRFKKKMCEAKEVSKKIIYRMWLLELRKGNGIESK